MSGSLRKMLRVKRDIENARSVLDLLAHRLRDGGPEMTREQIRDRVKQAAGFLNEVAPRSILRSDTD